MFNQETADKVCAELAEGKSLVVICKEIGCGRSEVYRWLEADTNGFRDKYARAREMQAETLVDEALEVIKGKPEDIGLARLQFDAIRWYAGKVRPKVYGDKQQVEHSGAVATNLSPEEALALAETRRKQRTEDRA